MLLRSTAVLPAMTDAGRRMPPLCSVVRRLASLAEQDWRLSLSQVGLVPLLELLLQSAARPDSRDAAGRTPLHYAVLHGRPEACLHKPATRSRLTCMGHVPAQLWESNMPIKRVSTTESHWPCVTSMLCDTTRRLRSCSYAAVLREPWRIAPAGRP